MTRPAYWITGAHLPRFPKQAGELEVDVVVVGGGLTGITTAYLLKQAGLRVALLERDRCVRADTAHTTAHLTYVTDRRLSQLVKSLGEDHAQAVWDAGLAAINEIEQIAIAEDIACDFRRVPGYSVSRTGSLTGGDQPGITPPHVSMGGSRQEAFCLAGPSVSSLAHLLDRSSEKRPAERILPAARTFALVDLGRRSAAAYWRSFRRPLLAASTAAIATTAGHQERQQEAQDARVEADKDEQGENGHGEKTVCVHPKLLSENWL